MFKIEEATKELEELRLYKGRVEVYIKSLADRLSTERDRAVKAEELSHAFSVVLEYVMKEKI